jgi:hypothetical protein
LESVLGGINQLEPCLGSVAESCTILYHLDKPSQEVVREDYGGFTQWPNGY